MRAQHRNLAGGGDGTRPRGFSRRGELGPAGLGGGSQSGGFRATRFGRKVSEGSSARQGANNLQRQQSSGHRDGRQQTLQVGAQRNNVDRRDEKEGEAKWGEETEEARSQLGSTN